MSKARPSYIHALLILFVLASLPVSVLAQGDSSAPGFEPMAPISFLIPPPSLKASQTTANNRVFTYDASEPLQEVAEPGDGSTQVAENLIPLQSDSNRPSGQKIQAAAPPPQVRQTTQEIKRQSRRWHIGGRIGAGFSPELFMFGLQSQIGPIFNPRVLFRPNVDFSFGELTDMFAINLEGSYHLRRPIHGGWNPYFGMGPSLNFIHQGTSTSDVSFSDFTYKTGFGVFVGAQKNRTFVEMKTSLWSGPAPVLRLVLGYNF